MAPSPDVATHASGGVECLNNVASQPCESAQRKLYWQCPVFPGFVERYAKGAINLAFCRLGREDQQEGFIISTDKFLGNDEMLLLEAGHGKASGSDTNCEQPPMFAHDVKLMERPENFISSWIRLQGFDNRTLAWGQPLYCFQSTFRIEHVQIGPSSIPSFLSHDSNAVDVECRPVAVRRLRSGQVDWIAPGSDVARDEQQGASQRVTASQAAVIWRSK